MPLTVQVRDERGTVLDEAVAFDIARLALDTWNDRSFSCLRFIDAHGDTIFNAVQSRELAGELRRAITIESVEAERVAEMADRVGGESHRYLWFIGD
jgi:hypothetical protein